MSHKILSADVRNVIRAVGIRPFALALDLTPEELPYFRRHFCIETCRLNAFLNVINLASEIIGYPLKLTRAGLVLEGIDPTQEIVKVHFRENVKAWWILKCGLQSNQDINELRRLRRLIGALRAAGFRIPEERQLEVDIYKSLSTSACSCCTRKRHIHRWLYSVRGTADPDFGFSPGAIVRVCSGCFTACSILPDGRPIKTPAEIAAWYASGVPVLNERAVSETVIRFIMPDRARRARAKLKGNKHERKTRTI